MTRIEKLTIAILVISVIASAALFGVWEDKVIVYGPLLVLVYAAIAVWATRRSLGVPSGSDVWRGAWRRQRSDVKGQPSEVDVPSSDLPWHGVAFGEDGRPLTSGSMIPPGGIMLLLFFLYSAVMIPFAVLPYEAKIATLRFGCFLGAYWASANILSRLPYRKAVWLTLLAALVFIALYSLVQHRVNPEMLFGRLRYANYGERLGGTYICPNHIAHLFQMALPFCLVFLFMPQFGWFWRICFAYCIPLFGLLIYQTQSRAGILGAIAALSATVLFMILRKSRRAFYIALLVVPLLGAGALGALWAGSAMFRTRMTPVVQVLQQAAAGEWERVASIDFRPMTWADTVVMIKDRPVFGFGPGNYALTYEDYRTRWQGVRRETVHPHNEYLELIAEYGLAGGVLFLSGIVVLIVRLVRLIRTSTRLYHALPAAAFLGALAGTGVHGLFDFELHNFPNALMFALLAGSAVAPLLQLQHEQKDKRRFTTADARGRQSESEGEKRDFE